ncbi:unnamed protein product, partial [Symbiodinium sp. CCMP2456]
MARGTAKLLLGFLLCCSSILLSLLGSAPAGSFVHGSGLVSTHPGPAVWGLRSLPEEMSKAVAATLASKFSERLVDQMQSFTTMFYEAMQKSMAEPHKGRFKLRFHPDPHENQGAEVAIVNWYPAKKSLEEVFAGLEWSITSFEISFRNNEGEKTRIMNEDDVDDLLSESKGVVIDVHLKQPSHLERLRNKALETIASGIKQAKHLICGEGQIGQETVSKAQAALISEAANLAKMQTSKSALSTEGFDIESFSKHVSDIAERLNMSPQEQKVLAMAIDADNMASLEMKTYYLEDGSLVKHLTSWRTIRSSTVSGNPPDKIYFVYGDFSVTCDVPDGGLAPKATIMFDEYVDLRAKLERAKQFGMDAEHVWGSRQYLVFIEWLEILLILGVFIITGQLLPAVIVGILVAAMSFLVKYSKVSAILGAPMRGSQVRLQHRVGEAAVHTLRQVQDSWLLAIRLKGFIFFGSVQGVTSMVATRIETEKKEKVPNYRRLQIVIFDCAQLDGIEVSAAKSLTKLTQESKSAGVQIIFSSVSNGLAKEMKSRGVIHGDHDLFPDMEAAIFYVEDLALQYAKAMEGLFSSLHPGIQYHQAVRKEQVTFEPFGGILVTDDARLGCPWRFCTKVDITKHSTLLWSSKDKHDVLYLIHTGSVGIFESIPEDRRHWKSPVAVYGHGQFLNLEMLAGRTPKGNAVCIESGQVIAWDRDQWRRMSRHEPVMAAKLLEAAMAQRQNESGSAENEEISSSICGEVSEQVMRLLAAKALKELGFFEPLPPGIPSSLPLLPERLKHDCRVGFRTFRRFTDEGQEVIDPYDVKSALMYAGIFGAQLSHERLFPLSEAQFVHVANEAYMTRFSARQIAIAEDLFGKFDADGSGALELDELHMVIQEMTGVDEVHDSQIDGLAAAWKGSCRVDQSGQLVIDRQTFLSIMSRYVKAHMNDYMLLQGLLEMTKTKPEELMSSKLTLEMLADALNTSGENAEVRVYRHAVAKLRSASLRQSMEDSTHESVMDVVQEIVWAHKPLTSAGGDSNLSSLDFTDLVAAAMPTELRPKNGATLPPKPPKKAARSHKEQLPAEDLHVLQSLVLDLREPKAQKTVFELGRWTAQRRISERIEDVQLDNGGERSISVQKLTSDEPAELTDLDRLKIRVFNFLERPKSSMAALAWFYADCILVILCVVSLVAEPLVLVVYP